MLLGAIRGMQAPSKAGHHQHKKKLDKSNLSATGVLQGSAPRASASTSMMVSQQHFLPVAVAIQVHKGKAVQKAGHQQQQ